MIQKYIAETTLKISNLMCMLRSLALFLAAAAPLAAQSQEPVSAYPSKPVKMIIPFAAGGPSDVLTRLFGQHLSEMWKQPFVVENRGGAGGVIGTEAIAKSAPDGYTLGVGSVGTHGINPSLFAKLPYDAINDFTPITLIATYPTILVVHPSVPATSVKELIAAMKASPEKYSFASAGLGSSAQLVGEMFKLATGTQMVHVPYKGDAPALADTVSGQVTLMFANLSANAMGFVQAGRLRALAVTSPDRSTFAPGVPAMAETIPGFQARTWAAWVAPAKMSAPLLAKIYGDVMRVMQMPSVQTRLKEFGAAGGGITPSEFAAYIKAEVELWRPVVKASGAKAE